MPIPSGALAKLRSSMHVVRPIINYFPAVEIATGTVTTTVTEYPIGEIAVTWNAASYLDVRIGQLVIIRSGGEIVTYGVIRLAPNSTTLYIDGKARGDGGTAVLQEFAITAGQTITVYTYQPLWALLSRIKDGKFYKKFNIPYDGSGSNPSPVCNIGSWRQVYANENTGYGRVSFDNDNSFAWLSKTIVSYIWVTPIGAVYVAGDANSDSITLDLPQGFHIVRCVITDSGGAVQSSYRPVWVNGDEFPALSERYGYEISSDTQDRTGRSISLSINGDFSDEEDEIFLAGGAFHMTEQAYFNGEEMDAGVLVDNFVGFSSAKTTTNDLVGGNKASGFEISSPFSWMQIIPMVSQAIVETASPADWTDVAMGLGTPNFMVWYILKHHSSFLDMFDYYPLTEDTPPRKLNWGLNGGTVAEYLNQTASVFGGNIGCVSDGSLYLRRDPNIETTNFRNTVDERMTIKIDPDGGVCDLISPPEIPKNFFNQIGQIRLYALVYDGTTTTAYGSIAPGYVQMQAASSQDEDSFIIKPTTTSLFWGGQDGVNFASGQLLARNNAPIKELSIALNRNMDIIDPAKMLWYQFQVPEEWSPTKKAILWRVMPVSVDRSWEQVDGGAWNKNISASISPETFGQMGETLLMDQGAATNYEPLEPPLLVEEEELYGIGFLGAINMNGKIGRSFNAESWNNIQGNIIGKPQDMALDYYSPYVQSGYAEGNLGAWVISCREASSGSGSYNRVEIWYTEDLLNSTVNYVLQYSFTAASDTQNSLRVISHVDYEDYVAACIHDTNGTRVARTIDGETWAISTVGDISVVGAAGALNLPCDIAFQGEMVITSGWNSGTNKWELAYADAGDPFTVANDSPESDVPYPMIDATADYIYATKVSTEVSTNITEFSMYVEDVSGTPTVRKRKREYTSYPSTFTDSFDPPEAEMSIEGTPINTPVNLTLYSANSPSQIWAYCTIGSPPPIDVSGWLLKDAGYTPQSIEAVMKIGIKGKGTISNAEFNIDTISKYPDETVWGTGDASGRFIFNTIEMFDKSGYTITGCQDITNRITSASYCDISSLGWGSVECSGGDVFDVASVTMTMDYPSPSGGSVPPAIVTNFSVLYSDYEVEIPTLYRIPNITSGSPTYTDITPEIADDQFVPMNPYALAADPMNEGKLNAVLRGGGGASYLGSSVDNGTTWDIGSDADYYYGLRQIDMFGLLWGTDTILYTEDNFENVVEFFNGWIGNVDNGGIIKTVKAAF